LKHEERNNESKYMASHRGTVVRCACVCVCEREGMRMREGDRVKEGGVGGER